MRKTMIALYEFDELDLLTQHTALNSVRNVNTVGNAWMGRFFNDAEKIGLLLRSKDFQSRAIDTARTILDYHAPTSEIAVLAKKYVDEFEGIRRVNTEIKSYPSAEFLSDLIFHFESIMRNEQEWLESDEAVTKAIRDSKIEFTRLGNRWTIINQEFYETETKDKEA